MIRIRRLTVQAFKQLQEVELAFPRRGRVLIQGPNESGKSTLFEAVFFGLFGRPLVTETAHQRLDDVIRYGGDAAWVVLELELTGGRRLVISRHVRRGRPNQWELAVHEADGRVEEVRGNNSVNQRVEAELRLDGEALLNTCFVEQKKLEKLEGLNRREREESLMKLLNLDALLALGDNLKVRSEDRARLARLADRARLASLRAELPDLQARQAEVAAAIGRHQAHAGLLAALAEMDVLERRAAELTAARRQAATLAEQAAVSDTYQAGLASLREAQVAWERAGEAQARAAQAAAELAAARSAGEEGLPAVLRQGTALRDLACHLKVVHRAAERRDELRRAVTEADGRLAQVAEDRGLLNEVRRDLVASRALAREAAADSERLAGDLRAFEVRDALRAWVAAREAAATLPAADERLATAREALARASHQDRLVLGGLGLVGLALLALWRLAAGDGAAGGVWYALLALLVTALAATGLRAYRRQQNLAATLARQEGEASVRAREVAVLAEQVAAAERRLTELNAVRPADPERAEVAVAELHARLADRTRESVAAELERTRRSAAEAEVGARALVAREAELRHAVGRIDAEALGRERDSWAGQALRHAVFAERWQAILAARAEGLNVDLTEAAIEGALGVLRGEHKSLKAQADQVPALETALAAATAAGTEHMQRVEALWAGLPPAPGLPAWVEVATAEGSAVWSAARAALSAAYDAAGGAQVARRAAAAAHEAERLAGGLDAGMRALGRSVETLSRQVREHASDLAWPAGDGPGRLPERAALSALTTTLGDRLSGEPQTLALEAEELTRRINVASHEIERLESALGLAGEALDPAAEAAAHAETERELAVRERAAELVGQTGRAVLQRVLPSTLEHMRRLLPALTDSRYFDAELTEDHRIRVLDERAGAWKQKNIFSGGTKDQLSLALRLAFALATLPEERGTAPSFLFLDEPLGAFDEQRAQALVALLATGEIADSFDQIFLISHVRVDEALFDHQVTLAEGRVVASTLPEGQSVGTPAMAMDLASE